MGLEYTDVITNVPNPLYPSGSGIDWNMLARGPDVVNVFAARDKSTAMSLSLGKAVEFVDSDGTWWVWGKLSSSTGSASYIQLNGQQMSSSQMIYTDPYYSDPTAVAGTSSVQGRVRWFRHLVWQKYASVVGGSVDPTLYIGPGIVTDIQFSVIPLNANGPPIVIEPITVIPEPVVNYNISPVGKFIIPQMPIPAPTPATRTQPRESVITKLPFLSPKYIPKYQYLGKLIDY